MRFLKFFLVVVLVSLPVMAELSIKNIEKMVRDIRAKRTSRITDTSPVVSPFIVIKQDENQSVIVKVAPKTLKTNFALGAIVNDTAYIDGTWRKAGDSVGEFHVKAIEDDHVILKSKDRTITLYFRKAKDILKTGKE